MNKREAVDAAFRAMEAALRDIAATKDYPPSPGDYAEIKITWRRMVKTARKAVAKLDALTPKGE